MKENGKLMEEVTIDMLENATGGLIWRDEEALTSMTRNARSLRWSPNDFKQWLRDHYGSNKHLPEGWLDEAIRYIEKQW